jgi:hypothetical protein
MPTPPTPETESTLTGEQWLELGLELRKMPGRRSETIAALQQAAAQLPLDVNVYQALAGALQADGQVADAVSALIGMDAIAGRRAIDLCEVAYSYAKYRQWGAAGHWFERAVMIEPTLAAAHICLAWVLRQLGRERGDGVNVCRMYRQTQAFIDATSAAKRRTVLLLCTDEHANVPSRHLLPFARNRVVQWIMYYVSEGVVRNRSRTVPQHDVVFNAVGDADRGAATLEHLKSFMATAYAPVLNPPAIVEQTSRDRIPSLLSGIEGMYMPPTSRWDPRQETPGTVHDAVAAGGLTYPVMLRPAGEHGGKGCVLLSSPDDDLEQPDPYEIYLTSYFEYRSPDGFYRKYRVIFIDGEPYPYHLAIGSKWLLHYFSAEMVAEPWKLEEERRFLDDAQGVLGASAWTALRAIGARMKLDYCGIDFSMMEDGRVLVFETNATMLVHPEVEDNRLRFKNVYIQKIFDAFDRMLARRVQEAG